MVLRHLFASALLMAHVAIAGPAMAENSPFSGGWTLSETGSNLHFISVKKGSLMESSTFATLGGTIDETGSAAFEVALDSIDTTIDLRNVRMRFLLFETFNFPKAEVTAQIDATLLENLEEAGSITMPLPFTLKLHGQEKDLETEVIVTLIGKNRVSIAAKQPVILKLEDFGLNAGREKLEEAAEVAIVPATSVLFHLVFDRNNPLEDNSALVASADVGNNAALEPEGNFDRAACEGRFEILSRTGNINFLPGSAALTAESAPVLEDAAYIIGKCPDMVVQVAGHTDSRGGRDYNQNLSQDRARSVVDYLVQQGVAIERLTSVGFGETQPIATNRSVVGRQKNRRIEFTILSFDSQS